MSFRPSSSSPRAGEGRGGRKTFNRSMRNRARVRCFLGWSLGQRSGERWGSLVSPGRGRLFLTSKRALGRPKSTKGESSKSASPTPRSPDAPFTNYTLVLTYRSHTFTFSCPLRTPAPSVLPPHTHTPRSPPWLLNSRSAPAPASRGRLGPAPPPQRAAGAPVGTIRGARRPNGGPLPGVFAGRLSPRPSPVTVSGRPRTDDPRHTHSFSSPEPPRPLFPRAGLCRPRPPPPPPGAL